MQLLPEFEVRYPATLAEAARLLADKNDALVLAGGTGLIANLRLGLGSPSVLVSLERVQELGDILQSKDSLRLGAGVTLARLVNEPAVRERFPALAEAAATIAGPTHRSSATLGGNLCLDTRCAFYNQNETWRRSNGYCLKYGGEICHVAPQGKRCHAAYSGDLAPVLLVLGAEIEIATASGTRRAPLENLYRDDGAKHLTLEHGEFISAVRIPFAPPGTRVGYRKARVRGAIDFPLAGVAVSLEMDKGRVRALKVSITGTNPYPIRLSGASELEGEPGDPGLADKLSKLVQKQVHPQRTTVTASNYRRQVAAALAVRLVRELAAAH